MLIICGLENRVNTNAKVLIYSSNDVLCTDSFKYSYHTNESFVIDRSNHKTTRFVAQAAVST